jgi:hypothetical protein
MRKMREAIQLFDSGDTRSFNDIYAGKEELFEDCDDIISPKMKALFESVYGSTQTRLREEVSAENNPDHNFSGKEGCPDPDGVPGAHNKAGLNGQDPETEQSGHDYSGNPALFEAMKDIYEQAKLKEDFAFDDDDDLEEFEFDAAESSDDFEDDNDLDDIGSLDSLDDLTDSSSEELFDDFDDGTNYIGSSDLMRYEGDEDEWDL